MGFSLQRRVKSIPRQMMAGLLAVSFLLAGCTSASVPGDPTLRTNLAVDPVFRTFYEKLGGMEILGPVISDAKTIAGVTYQYTENALLVYDPQSPEPQRYRLSPLGRDWQVDEPPVAPPEGTGELYIDGHIVYTPFVSLFQLLGGTRYTGRPLSEVHYNPEEQKYEQYFENVGFRLDASNPDQEPRLLPYGAYKCDAYCRKQTGGITSFSPPKPVAAYFVDSVARLGPDFTGPALIEPRYTPDGYVEQVFGNLVLVADPDQPGRVFARPITLEIGILPGRPAPDKRDPDYQFIPLEGGSDRGYNVPNYFLDYLALHGGSETAGKPITELNPLSGGGYQQCFTNLCLNVTGLETGVLHIQAAQHGYTYRQMPSRPVEEALSAAAQPVQTEAALTESPAASTLEPDPAAPADPLNAPPVEPAAALPAQPAAVEPAAAPQVEVTVQIWKSFAFVSQQQPQEIGVLILENGLPVRGLDPNLAVELPDGDTRTYYMYPTGEQGQSVMQIDPLDVPDGSMIPYQVCVFYPGGEQFCARDSFLVWNNP